MSACLMVGAVLTTLAAPDFTLAWRHSVEKVEWRETWSVEAAGLRLVEAAVKGSGAGMEPGDGATLRGGWWVWSPGLPPVSELVLAASGATGQGWRLCSGGSCRDIGTEPGAPVVLAPCPA